MRIAIIGGNSNLGTALKTRLALSHEVITVGRKNCDVDLDLKDAIDNINLPANLDTVIHTAAHFGGKSDNDIRDAEYINVIGTLKLCQAAKKANVKHFILVSSIFSSINPGSQQYNIYTLSKKHAEELAGFYCSQNALPLTIIRPAQLYGNSEGFRKHQPFFYDLIDKAGRGEDISLYGSHDPKRNYIHIDDVTRVIAEVVEKKIEGIYSCAQLNYVTYKQIAETAFHLFKKGGSVYFLKDKPNIPDNLVDADSSLYEKIGFYPEISLEEGIRRLVIEKQLHQ